MSSPRRVEIPMFPGARRIAVTSSWDDGTIHDRSLVAAMNEWGLKGTFNLNSGFLQHAGTKPADERAARYINAEEVASLYAGHEVAIHTLTHPFLTRIDGSQIADEVLRDRQNLEDLVGYPVRGMAYPFGAFDQRVIESLRALGVVYSRTCANAENPWPISEPLAWPSTGHIYSQTPGSIPERFERMYQQPRAAGLFYVWGHSYEFAQENHSWDDMGRLLKPLSGKSDVWYCTNIELFDYEDARRRLVVAGNRKSAFNPSAIAVTIVVDGKPREIAGGEVVGL